MALWDLKNRINSTAGHKSSVKISKNTALSALLTLKLPLVADAQLIFFLIVQMEQSEHARFRIVRPNFF